MDERGRRRLRRTVLIRAEGYGLIDVAGRTRKRHLLPLKKAGFTPGRRRRGLDVRFRRGMMDGGAKCIGFEEEFAQCSWVIEKCGFCLGT
ncbi:hypothetical protein Zmor_020063 [Zophobas morio]|uniref:Uncharacterized protein n=1 Tax=Zophobas morio TaxID=2755281 RepID=A0AA38M945_9CUCU|nr:hypothetical protein Zmor_020063 [Zophobas morio]